MLQCLGVMVRREASRLYGLRVLLCFVRCALFFINHNYSLSNSCFMIVDISEKSLSMYRVLPYSIFSIDFNRSISAEISIPGI